jgi:hypothetical protein
MPEAEEASMTDYFAVTGGEIIAEDDDLARVIEAARDIIGNTGTDAVIWKFTRQVVAVVFADGSTMQLTRP